jgi:hypothetical protein
MTPAPRPDQVSSAWRWKHEIVVGGGINYRRGPGFGGRGYVVSRDGFSVGGLAVYHPGLDESNLMSHTGPLSYFGAEFGFCVSDAQYRAHFVTGVGIALVVLREEQMIKHQQANETVYPPTIGVTVQKRFGDLNVGISPNYVLVPDAFTFLLYLSIGAASD